MRLRAGLILFFLLLLILVVGGCRKPLAPTFDRNQAPETWITAAPLDTITYREGPVPKQTPPGYIPFRYHMYWAGSDPDGKVVGFYFAVVETLTTPIPPATTPPPLPGPKPHDYHFTTKTDSTFIFDVTDNRPDRQHAFYIYAVDNLGKADPTPARFIFNSIDRYPPIAVIDKFITTGFAWTQDPVSLALVRAIRSDTVTASDTFHIGAIPAKTVPTGSRIDIAWHSEMTTVDNPAVGYRYKLDEPDFVNVGATTTTLSYNTGPGDAVGPGVKIFRLRAIDQAGGARIVSGQETTRLFQMNLPPITWWAGADLSNPIWSHPGTNEKYITVTHWPAAPGDQIKDQNGAPVNLAGISLMSSDSVKIMPAQRKPRRNFLEIFRDPSAPTGSTRDRLWVRQEGDTVNMNSWVIFFNGGFDPDSPYNVQYHSNDPLAPDSTSNPVLQIRPSNGSPVGFRSRVPAFLYPNGPLTVPSQTGLYPIFDPASVFRAPQIASYWGMGQAGTAYMFARAQDGDGQVDTRIGTKPELQPDKICYAVDSTGSATAEQIALRPLIIRFFVDKAPTLNLSDPTFKPAPNLPPSPIPPYSRVLNISFQGASIDPDPLDPANPANVGGPTTSKVFRYQMKFRGPRNHSVVPGDSVTYVPLTLDRVGTATLPSTVSLPDSLGGTTIRVMIEICDCSECENVPGQGRCNYLSYQIRVAAPPEPALGTNAVSAGPGDVAIEEKKRGER